MSPSERTAVLLRYFEGFSLRECGQALNLSPDGARMRIGRALAKMRRRFERAGITLTVAALAALMAKRAPALPPAVPVTAPRLDALSPRALPLQAARGVCIKMNLLLCKPVALSLLGGAVLISSRLFVPGGTHNVHSTALRTAALPSPARGPRLNRSVALATLQTESGTNLIDELFTSQSVLAGTEPPTQLGPQIQSGRPAAAARPSVPEATALPQITVRQTVPRESLPQEARRLLDLLDAQTTDEPVNPTAHKILDELRAIEKRYTSEGQLDRAVTVRDGMEDFKLRVGGVLPDPGVLTSYRENVGRSYLFSVVGRARQTPTSETTYRLDLLSTTGRVEQEKLLRGATSESGETAVIRLRIPAVGTTSEQEDAAVHRNTNILSESLVDLAVAGSSTIWGTDIYTDDSALAVAAVHAGALKDGEKGVVKVTIFAGKEQYDGSVRNGVSSNPYGDWQGSYMVERAAVFSRPQPRIPAAARAALAELGAPAQASPDLFDESLSALRKAQQEAQRSGSLEDALLVRDTIASVYAARTGAQPDPGNVTAFRSQNGRQLTFLVRGSVTGPVWGDGIYTDDSNLGTAAVHAGLVKPGQTAIVRITILPGRDGYPGGTRNGVTAIPYGVWTGSYRMELLVAY